MIRWLRWLVLLGVALFSLERAAWAADFARVAVVVGANLAPPGRAPLRYAHEDARGVADVLTAVAGFAAENVHVLLDPEPAALLAALDRELVAAGQRSGDTLLFFYYSGHADERSIFPGGKTLLFSELKSRLEDPRAKLRVGLVDSCRGGSWTGSKGLKRVEPFEIDAARELAEEGSVLIASSSGQENAHETDSVRGSFFTHYWNAGLRGAADRGGDGVITLNEAFEYARALTIRDTALAGQVPQHPSFQMKLAGRRDFPLATLAKERTTLLFEQSNGPIEFVRLSDGLVVVESPSGARTLRLGLPVGSYLVRRRTPEGVWARVVSLDSGRASELKESELERSSLVADRAKGTSEGSLEPLSFRSHDFYGSVSAGVRHAPLIDPGLRVGASDGTGILLLRASVRLARRLWLNAPLALVFDAEHEDRLNYLVWAGAPVLGFTHQAVAGVNLRGFIGTGLDGRARLGEQLALNGSIAALGSFGWVEHGDATPPNTWTAQFTLGLSQQIAGTVTFNLGVAFALDPVVRGHWRDVPFDSVTRNAVLAIGSVQRSGLRPLPLIHIPLSPAWSIDAHVAVAYLPALHGWEETYTGGVTYQN